MGFHESGFVPSRLHPEPIELVLPASARKMPNNGRAASHNTDIKAIGTSWRVLAARGPNIRMSLASRGSTEVISARGTQSRRADSARSCGTVAVKSG